MSRRRRGGGNEMVTIYWRDIPAQVTASDGGPPEKVLLPERFQHAIDRAAAVAGLTDADLYVAEWRRESAPLTGDAHASATAEADRLDAAITREVLEALVRGGGNADPATAAAESSSSPTNPQKENE